MFVRQSNSNDHVVFDSIEIRRVVKCFCYVRDIGSVLSLDFQGANF